MLPGITGTLVAGDFMERALESQTSVVIDGERACRRLGRWWARVERRLGPASSPRAVLDLATLPLVDLLGYEVLHLEPFRDGFAATIGRGSALAALRVTPWGANAEAAWRETVRASRVAHARWGVVHTGTRLRVVDASRTWSRRALEFDLPRVAADERSVFALLALLGRESLDERSTGLTLDRLVAASDAHGTAVCGSLSHGVLDALGALLTAFGGAMRRRRPRLDPLDTFQQSLTVVYRLLFLLFAEAREVVPVWHEVYRNAYTVEALRRRAEGGRGQRGLWAAVQAIGRLAHAGCRAGDLTVTAFNGRLFSPARTPLAENARLPDAIVASAVRSLTTTAGADGCRRIAYADLGVEQLGAVYERVLEFEPSRAPGPLVLTRTSHERKRTGSFYTPRAMTEFLVRRTLHPLVDGLDVERILQLRIVDPAMGSGAFLVTACRYLAEAAERALVSRGEWAHDEDTPARRTELRRLVAQRCLYGVDRNPMAVQLARLSLWLTTLAGDRPLTFLDHHLATGDSLIGAPLAEIASPPRRTCSRLHTGLPLFDHAAGQLAAAVVPERFRLAIEPGDTAAAVRDKERALDALTRGGAPLARWKTVADLWCAGWFWRDGTLSGGVYHDVAGALVGRLPALPERQRTAVLCDASALAREHAFFHWELEFPEVFFDATGRRSADAGFDAVIGNPPWDTMRADTGDRAARDRTRDLQRLRLRFFRDSRLYRHQGSGHANWYQLFLERTLQLARPGGRFGLVLPSGVATDVGSGRLRRALLDETRLDRLTGFDNRDAIFPIHRDVRFVLVTGTRGGRTDALTCAFARTDPAWLDRLPDACQEDPPEARPIVLGRRLLESWDPDHLAIPLLAHPADLVLLEDVTRRIPALAAASGWQARFGRELNATDDRAHFVEPRGERTLLEVVDGKHLEPFRVKRGASTRGIPRGIASKLLDPGLTFARPRIGYRDVASATNRLTLIAALIPRDVVSTHTIYCLKTPLGEASQYCLLALLNSLVANYLVRLHVTTHVTTARMARLPVPRPRAGSPAFRELARLAQSLERTGVDGDVPGYVRANSIAAELYGLNAAQYAHVVGTFPLIDEAIRQACLENYRPREP